MAWLQGFLIKLASGLIEKVAKFFWRLFLLKKEIADNKKKVEAEAIAINEAVAEASKDGVISKEEEDKIREKTRNLIRGTFDN